jgi:hypothetical protein
MIIKDEKILSYNDDRMYSANRNVFNRLQKRE